MTSHRCWAEIDRAALRHNAEVARRCVGPKVQLLAVIKANGYGHGLREVAQTLADTADLFGVANLAEAIEARKALVRPIVILGPALPEERAEIATHGFIPSVSDFGEASEYNRVANASPVSINFTIDTGMGRIGVAEESAADELKAIAQLPNIQLHSVATHLPSADEDEAFSRTQLARFAKLITKIRREVPGNYKTHALPSAGVIQYTDSAFDIVRAGLMLYGASPIPAFQAQLGPVMTLKTRVVLLRELPAGKSISYGRTFVTNRTTRVATLSCGYADGFPRALSNRGACVLIGGRRCPLLGRVTMDLIMVDVTDLTSVAAGDEAVLIGRQDGQEIFAQELADRASTIAWEIFTGIGSRVARVYL